MISDNTITQFADHLAVERDASKKTIQNYTSDLRLFIEWLTADSAEPFDPAAVTAYDVKRFKEHLQEIGRKPATVNRYLISLKMYFDYCIDAGMIEKSPARKVRHIPAEKEAPRSITQRDEMRLVRAVERFGSLRDYTIIVLMLHTGLRAGEVCKLRWSDVTMKERSGELLIRASKRGKYRTVPLNLTARNLLRDYKDSLATANNQTDNVFPGRKGVEPLTPRNLGYLLQKYSRLAEVEHISPHDLRHRFAYKMSKEVDLHLLATIMGHDDINTTRVYTTPTKEDLARAVDMIASDG